MSHVESPTNLAEFCPSIIIRLPTALTLSDDQLLEFAAINRELRIERTVAGRLILQLPVGAATSCRNSEITMQLCQWSHQNRSGTVFSSSAGFILPNTAMRSPDGSWVSHARLKNLTHEQREKFLPLCPEFVVELVSNTDPLRDVKEKLEEYIEQGAKLGLVIDPEEKRVYIYRPDVPVEELEQPDTVSCNPELPGFTLVMHDIWKPL